MKKIIFLAFVAAWIATFPSCDKMYDSINDFATGETVYPGRYDTITGKIGYERVEIDLLKAGRISADKIKLGKATKTVIRYDGQDHVIDSLCSWVNITGLTESKLYRFEIYTMDDYGNKSVPVEIALIPFTGADRDALTISTPRISSSPTSAVVDWPAGVSNIVLDYCGLSYEYTDKDGLTRSGDRPADDSRFFVGNLESGSTVNIRVNYKVVPKVNRVQILDTLTLNRQITFYTATGSTPFSPSERAILAANGISTFTADGVASVEKLVFPLHLSSIQDVFYFPNLKELDLTGGFGSGLNLLPVTVYDNRGYRSEVGGGPWLPFMERVDDVDPAVPVMNGVQSLVDLLEAGLLEKIRYIPGSLGLDSILQPYVEKGIVDLVSYDEYPDEILIPNYFYGDGRVQDGNWEMEVVYNPASYPPAPAGVELEEVYKATCLKPSSSFFFALPKEYRWALKHYKYFKMKIYSPGANVLTGNLKNYATFWPRFMSCLWAFTGNTTHGQASWAIDNVTIPDEKFASWHEFAPISMDNTAAGDTYRYNRVIVMNFGHERGIDPTTGPEPMIFYVANVRICKNP